MAPNPALLHLQDLTHTYHGKPALRLAEWKLPSKAQALVTGPSGCGKTTLLQLITGILPVQHGHVHVLGQCFSHLTLAGRDDFRGRHIGMVMQNLHLIPVLTVLENLHLARRLAGKLQDDAFARTLLKQLGVLNKANAYPHQLSQGEAQRVAIARALVHQPQLIVTDEPTSALDDANARTVCELLQTQAAAHGAGLIVVSHDARLKSAFKTVLNLGGKN